MQCLFLNLLIIETGSEFGCEDEALKRSHRLNQNVILHDESTDLSEHARLQFLPINQNLTLNLALLADVQSLSQNIQQTGLARATCTHNTHDLAWLGIASDARKHCLEAVVVLVENNGGLCAFFDHGEAKLRLGQLLEIRTHHDTRLSILGCLTSLLLHRHGLDIGLLERDRELEVVPRQVDLLLIWNKRVLARDHVLVDLGHATMIVHRLVIVTLSHPQRRHVKGSANGRGRRMVATLGAHGRIEVLLNAHFLVFFRIIHSLFSG